MHLSIRRGETFALVGESGCGKSMTALALMRLLPENGRIVGGRVVLEGEDLLTLPESSMRAVRGGRIGMIFQEPGTSLNPVMPRRHADRRGDRGAHRAARRRRRVPRRSSGSAGSASPSPSGASTSTRSACRAARSSA